LGKILLRGYGRLSRIRLKPYGALNVGFKDSLTLCYSSQILSKLKEAPAAGNSATGLECNPEAFEPA